MGSTSITTDSSGDTVSEMRYSPWGSVRFSDGISPTDIGFNGQRSRAESFGLIYFQARWFDPSLGRFSQADTIIPNPGSTLDWDRYSFVRNNPLRYIDPSGHECIPTSNGKLMCSDDPDSYEQLGMLNPDEDYTIPTGSVELDENGEKIEELFTAYQEELGYTIEEFVLLILSNEFQPIGSSGLQIIQEFLDDLAQAATHWLYINEGELSENAILNWLGGMDSAWFLYGHMKEGKFEEIDPIGASVAQYVFEKMKSPPVEWVRSEENFWNGNWDPVNTHFYTWENLSLWNFETTSDLVEILGHEPKWIIPGENPWFLFTLEESSLLEEYKK